MREIGAEELKDDHLKRIQEEIHEVAKREQELRTEYMRKMADPNENIGHDLKVNKITEDVISSGNSDDSGFSSTTSQVNRSTVTTNGKSSNYVRHNGFNAPASLPPPKILTRTMSTPQMFTSTPVRKFNVNLAQKGIMQKFIASRGKIVATVAAVNSRKTINGVQNNNDIIHLDLKRQMPIFIAPVVTSPPVIERDTEGRPIRRGYIPVEEKIQKELREMKSREVELKRIRRQSLRQSQQDLHRHEDSLGSADNSDCEAVDRRPNGSDYELEDDDDDEVEHCFAPGKLRTSKSISELCEALNSSNASLEHRNSPSPQFERRSRDGLRPAISLAQLCDLDPKDAPSSHRLIAQWENIIQKRQEVTI